MKENDTPEDMLKSCLARCATGIAARMANADAAGDYNAHDRELNAAVLLLNASARLADSLARLRGTTHTMRVLKEGAPANGGSNGQKNR